MPPRCQRYGDETASGKDKGKIGLHTCHEFRKWERTMRYRGTLIVATDASRAFTGICPRRAQEKERASWHDGIILAVVYLALY